MKLLTKLWHDDCGGFLNSAELIFLGSLLVIGLVPGISSLRDAILTELCDMAAAVDHIAPPFNHPPQGNGPTIQGGEEGSSAPSIVVCSQFFN